MIEIIIISYSYPPVNAPAAQRPYFFAKYIHKYGIRSSVLTSNSSDSSLGHSEWATELLMVEVIRTANIRIDSLRTLKNKSLDKSPQKVGIQWKAKLYRLLSELTIPDKGMLWIPFALYRGIKQIRHRKPAIIFSTSPLFSNHIVALMLKKIFKIPWIADFRDFHYIENIESAGYQFSWRFHRLLEKKVLTLADRVVFISHSMKNIYTMHYPMIANKTDVIYNGLDIMEYEPLLSIPQGKPFTIFYAGSFYAGERSPLPLMLALEHLVTTGEIPSKDISVLIAGNIEKHLQEELMKLQCYKAINFLGIISRKNVIDQAKKSHLLWLIIGNEVKHSAGFPVKGYEYMGAGRPILAFVPPNTEASDILTATGTGIMMENSIEHNAVTKNAETIRNVYLKYKAGELNNPLSTNKEIFNLFTRQKQAEQLATVVMQLIKP